MKVSEILDNREECKATVNKLLDCLSLLKELNQNIEKDLVEHTAYLANYLNSKIEDEDKTYYYSFNEDNYDKEVASIIYSQKKLENLNTKIGLLYKDAYEKLYDKGQFVLEQLNKKSRALFYDKENLEELVKNFIYLKHQTEGAFIEKCNEYKERYHLINSEKVQEEIDDNIDVYIGELNALAKQGFKNVVFYKEKDPEYPNIHKHNVMVEKTKGLEKGLSEIQASNDEKLKVIKENILEILKNNNELRLDPNNLSDDEIKLIENIFGCEKYAKMSLYVKQNITDELLNSNSNIERYLAKPKWNLMPLEKKQSYVEKFSKYQELLEQKFNTLVEIAREVVKIEDEKVDIKEYCKQNYDEIQSFLEEAKNGL